MKMKRLLNLQARSARRNRRENIDRAHPSINAARFLLFKNTFLTLPLWSNRYSIRQNRRFHSSARVRVRPLPSSGATMRSRPAGSGTRKSSTSLLNSAMRKFSWRMMRFAMSCASSFAPSVSRGREDNAVSGFESRMAAMRRTISGQDIVWISSCEESKGQSVIDRCGSGTDGRLECGGGRCRSGTCRRVAWCSIRTKLFARDKRRKIGGRRGA